MTFLSLLDPLVSRAHSRESGRRDYSPLSPPSLPFSQVSHFTHLQPDELDLVTEMVSRTQLSQQRSPCQNFASQTPSIQNISQKGRGVPATSYVFTEHRLHGVTYNRVSTNGGGPIEEGQRYWRLMENDRDRITLITNNSLRVQFPGWSIPGKIWMLTNQITAISAGAHVYRELCACALQAFPGI